jgi:hypothetical protein
MNPVRIIYDDAPDTIPVPEAFRHCRSEIIIWPLPADTTQTNAGKSVSPEQNAKRKRRVPPPALAGKVRELGDVMSSASASDWGLDE